MCIPRYQSPICRWHKQHMKRWIQCRKQKEKRKLNTRQTKKVPPVGKWEIWNAVAERGGNRLKYLYTNSDISKRKWLCSVAYNELNFKYFPCRGIHWKFGEWPERRSNNANKSGNHKDTSSFKKLRCLLPFVENIAGRFLKSLKLINDSFWQHPSLFGSLSIQPPAKLWYCSPE